MDDLDYWALGRTPDEAIHEWAEKTDNLVGGNSDRVEVYRLEKVGLFDVSEVTEIRIVKVNE